MHSQLEHRTQAMAALPPVSAVVLFLERESSPLNSGLVELGHRFAAGSRECQVFQGSVIVGEKCEEKLWGVERGLDGS